MKQYYEQVNRIHNPPDRTFTIQEYYLKFKIAYLIEQ